MIQKQTKFSKNEKWLGQDYGSGSGLRSSLFILLSSLFVASASLAQNEPPNNPYLAHSLHPLGHGSSPQQDSLAVKGPEELSNDEIQHTHSGPNFFELTAPAPHLNGFTMTRLEVGSINSPNVNMNFLDNPLT